MNNYDVIEMLEAMGMIEEEDEKSVSVSYHINSYQDDITLNDNFSDIF